MIKLLKASDTTVRKFKAYRTWKYDSTDSADNIILEQGDNIPLFVNSYKKLSTEQSGIDFKINVKYGKNIKGTFFTKESKHYDETKEPINYDGTYQRTVYNSVKHLFYNDYGLSGEYLNDKLYKNPMYVFGSETGKYTNESFNSEITKEVVGSERRILGNSVTVLEVPKSIFGEKIKPKSIKIKDYSSMFDSIDITDDGYTNLVVGEESFNRISETNLDSSFFFINESESNENKAYLDYSDLSFGTSLTSHDDYFLTGAPVDPTGPSENQTGVATMYKYNKEKFDFDEVKKFYSPFTQSGLSAEVTNDNASDFILTELGDILTNSNAINDEFGKVVEMNSDICAIGSPSSSISGEDKDDVGHVFVYEKNKGGSDNWGIINVFEGNPESRFGESISIFRNYMVVGSPGFNNNNGVVYIFKKTKRTKQHPWIKTSSVYSSYEFVNNLKKFNNDMEQETHDYIEFLNLRSEIVTNKIKNQKEKLKSELDKGTITSSEYYDNIPTQDDFSYVYPFDYLYMTRDEAESKNVDFSYKTRLWSSNAHPSVRCKEVSEYNYYQKSTWPGYITNSFDGSYIPNPDHIQNKNNKWAYRWKLQNVSGSNSPLKELSSGEGDCNTDNYQLFDESDIHSFGDTLGMPMVEYSETPPNALGDFTFDLIGMITAPSDKIKNFGENVKIYSDKIYVTNPSSDEPRCFVYGRGENRYGCEEWFHKSTISDIDININEKEENKLDKTINYVDVNYNTSYIEFEFCPSSKNYSNWYYDVDKTLIESSKYNNKPTIRKNLAKQNKCEMCDINSSYNYYTRLRRLRENDINHLSANYGDFKNISTLINKEESDIGFYTKTKFMGSFSSASVDDDSIAISWKNFRENISFAFPNVKAGKHPSFMTIYSNEAKQEDGTYDPIYTLAEIGAQETLNNEKVRLYMNSTSGDSEFYYEFLFKGSIEGTHFTLNELKESFDYKCTLPPNQGSFVRIESDEFEDILESKHPKFFSKSEFSLSYVEPWSSDDSIAISWKNFRENVSFSYPNVKAGKHPSFMTIYSNEAKQEDGTYDPIYTLAEIGAQETLNNEKVRLTLNHGSVGGDEFYYEFLFKGSIEGTHFTLNELKDDILSANKSKSVTPKKIKLVKYQTENNINLKFNNRLNEYKAFRTLKANIGTEKTIFELTDDFLNGGDHSRFYFQEKNNTNTQLETSVYLAKVRENVTISYPLIPQNGTESIMNIYSDDAKRVDGTYKEDRLLASITSYDSLNFQIVRIYLHKDTKKETFYEFVFDGTPSGTNYTLSELETKISPRFNIPLSVYSPKPVSCRIKINRNKLSQGSHKLYIVLQDKNGNIVGDESVIPFNNNPILHNLEYRHLSVNKKYRYSYGIKSNFGKSIDANDKYLLIGNPTDREFSPLNNLSKKYTAGTVFVFSLKTNKYPKFIEKIYGEKNSEHLMDFKFGNDISLLGNNFIVGGHCEDKTRIELDPSDDDAKLEIEDFTFGVDSFKEDKYQTTNALITNYRYSLDSEHGDAEIIIDVSSLDIDKDNLEELTVVGDFIDTGEKIIRLGGGVGNIGEKINGIYTLIDNPINISNDCIISEEEIKIYINQHGWGIFYDEIRKHWVLSDHPPKTIEDNILEKFEKELKIFEVNKNINLNEIVTNYTFDSILSLYEVKDKSYIKNWKNKLQKKNKDSVFLFELIMQLESQSPLQLTNSVLEKIFVMYNDYSSVKQDISLLESWISNLNKISSIFDIIDELEEVSNSKITLNFYMMRRIIQDIYQINDDNLIKSWAKRLGYEYLTNDLLSSVRLKFSDEISNKNLLILSKLTNVDTQELTDKWESFVNKGILVADVFSDILGFNKINFILSETSDKNEKPTKFEVSVGNLKNLKFEIVSNNDTANKKDSLTWGVYRDKTKLINNKVYLYVNKIPNIDFTDSLVFIYNSVKNAVNGFAYYYRLDEKSELKRKIKTNKEKYSARKQYGYSVSLSSNFIFCGSPVIGDFDIDQLITFGGDSVTTFGKYNKLFLEYNSIHPSKLADFKKALSGSVISYDHSAIRDNKKYYLGNSFYKNGIISLTDTRGYFSNLFGSSSSGYEIEFKSTQTIFENEILCKVNPGEFNFSTNPTALYRGNILFDVNEDNRFDINDLTYIFKYIMGSVILEKEDVRTLEERIYGIRTESNSESLPSLGSILTESEDVLLIESIMSVQINEEDEYDKILVNLEKLYDLGEFDIDGDGLTTDIDAKLLLRYFMGRTGKSLTDGLNLKFSDATRTKSSEITAYLDEKTGKNIGRKIVEEFLTYEENDKKDTQGSYLAPYATTIGLYDGLNLVMVAKLGRPVKILPNYPINFLVKFDS